MKAVLKTSKDAEKIEAKRVEEAVRESEEAKAKKRRQRISQKR